MKRNFIASASRVVLKAARETPGEMLAPWAGFYRAAKEIAGTGNPTEVGTTVIACKGPPKVNPGRK